MERELKWHADARLQDEVAAWATALCTAKAHYEMDARYYDTADGMLAARRAGLRIRRENGESVCCLKCDVHTAGAEHIREEYECPADTIEHGLAALPAAGAPAALCDALAQSGVQEICRVRFIRHALTLTYQGATAELALDTGTLSRSGQEAPLCEIELEAKSGSDEGFRALCARLSSAFFLRPEPRSKLARAMALQASQLS